MSSLASQPRTRLAAVAIALILALTAQYLFTGEILTRFKDSNTWVWQPSYSLAAGLLLSALLCSIWALSWYEERQAVVELQATGAMAADRRLYWIIGGALGCYLLSTGIYLAAGENDLVRILWLAGIVILLTPWWPKRDAAIILPPVSPLIWGLIALISLIGFWLRFWNLTELPSHVDNDVALMGTFARDLIRTENYNWIGFSGSEHLRSYEQFLAWRMRIFGQDHAGLVSGSVISGALTVPIVFLLGRELFGTRVGLIATALLAINYTHIHFSRIMFGPVSTFSAVLAFYLLFRGLRTKQPQWFVFAGLTTGTGILMYYSSRVIPVILAGLWFWQLLREPRAWRTNLGNWILLGLGAVIGFGPMLAFALTEFDQFVGRGNRVMLWVPEVWNHAVASYNASSALDVVLEQAKRTLLAFHLYGDSSPHFALPRPAVAPITAALLVLGIGFCLARPNDLRRILLLLWIGLTFLLGGVLTNDPPYWPHLNITLPAVMIIAAVAADRMLALLRYAFGQRMFDTARIVLIGVILFTAVSNWYTYITYADNNAGTRIRIARFIDSLPQIYTVLLVSDSVPWDTYAFQFFNSGVPGRNIAREEIENTPPVADGPLLFILHDHKDLAELLRDRYPGGVLQAHLNQSNDTVFVSYQVIPGVMADSTLRERQVEHHDYSGLPFLAGVILFVCAQVVLFVLSGSINETTLQRLRRMFVRPPPEPPAAIPPDNQSPS